MEGMQLNTEAVVNAITEIVNYITEINSIMETIAAAVEEQTATTNEISKNISATASAADSVSNNIAEIVKNEQEVSRNIDEVSTAAQGIARDAAEASAATQTVTKSVRGVKEMDKPEVLMRCDLFRDLDAEQLAEVGKLCTSEIFETGEILCKQGKRATKLYVIEDGVAGIILEVGQLSQRQVQAASNFEAVGWSALIEPYIYTATVKAIDRTKALAFMARELGLLLRTRTDIGYKVGPAVSYVVAKRLHESYKQLLGVTDED